MKRLPTLGFVAAALLSLAALARPARAQEAQESSPLAALSAALVAACRQSDVGFARYLTAENAGVFRELPESQRTELMKRFVLMGEAGRPLLSADAQGRTVLRCSAPGVTGELRLGPERLRENVAFIAVDAGGRQTEIGMVREGGGWRILSLGLLLVNLKELSKQWAAAELEQKEAAAVSALRRLADALKTYREAFGALPEKLEQLGPAPKEGVSPEAAQLVDSDLASGLKAGYRFRYRIMPPTDAGAPEGFELAATPVEYGKTGRRSFFLDSTGRLRGGDKQGAVATSADPLIESPRKE